MGLTVYSVLVIIFALVQQGWTSCSKPLQEKDGKIQFENLEGNMIPSTLDVKYDAKGLQPFFNLANSFMNTVQPKSISVKLKGVTKNFKYNDPVVVKYETPILVAIVFGLLFVLLMPIVGLCFCCCRCANNCGGKMFQHPKDSEKHSKCFIMSIILLIVVIFMLCGVLFMFVTNNRTHDTAKNLAPTFDKVVDNVENVKNSTVNTVKTISGDFVPCMIRLINGDISTHAIKNLIGIPLRDFVNNRVGKTLDDAEKMAETVDVLKGHLDNVKAKSDDLKNLGTELNSKVNDIKTSLDNVYNECVRNGAPECATIKEVKNKISVSIDLNNLPDIQQSINTIKEVQDANIKGAIATAKQNISNIPQMVADKSSATLNDIHNSINNLETDINKQVDKTVGDIDKEINNLKAEALNIKDKYMDANSDFFKYENYRWYAYSGLAGLMAFIVLLLGLGLTLGICGYKKDVQTSKRSSISNCGGNCLMSGVGFMFIFSSFLMLFCVLWYAVGIHLYLVCRDLKNGELIDNFVGDRLKVNGKVISFNSVLNGCRSNKPIYVAIGGESIYNITKNFNFEDYTNKIDKDLEKLNFNLTDTTILSQSTENALKKVNDSGVSTIDYEKFFDTLKSSITNTSLTSVANEVQSISNQFRVSNKTTTADLLDQIRTKIINLNLTTVSQISGNATELDAVVKDTKEEANKITVEAGKLLGELQNAQQFLVTDTFNEILVLVRKFATRLISFLVQASDFLVEQATSNLLKCKPVADLYDGLVNTLICDDVVQNANGFWLALGWCLLFFVIAIIFSVKLAKYYRKMDFDSGLDKVDNPPYNDKIPLQTMEGSSQRRFGSTSMPDNLLYTEYNSVPQYDDDLLLPDYEMEHPPPYQQHQNQGYN